MGDLELKPLHQHTSNGQPTYPPPPGNSQQQPFVASSQGRMFGRFRRSRFGATYTLTGYDKTMIGVMIILNILLLILALGTLFAGFLCVTYRGSYADLCSDNEWFAASFCILVVGFIVLGLVVVNFIAIHKKSSRLLKIFLVLLLILFLGEATAGIYAFARREFIEDRFKVCMKDAYQKEYMDPSKEHVTKAWDLFQRRFDCCGVDDSYDYRSNNKFGPQGPKSCGGSEADARARQPCFEVIRREVFDNFHIIGGAAVGIGGFQLITLVVGVFLVRIFYNIEENE